MDLKKLIESDKSPEAIASNIYQEDNEFEKLSSPLTEQRLGEADEYTQVFSKEVDTPLSDPAHFDDKLVNIFYGQRTDESVFIFLETKKGSFYSVGDPHSMKEAQSQASELLSQNEINLEELNSQKV